MALIDRKKQRLEELEEEYKLLNEKLRRLRNAYRIETDEARRFQLESQIEREKVELDELEKEMKKLSSEIKGAIPLFSPSDQKIDISELIPAMIAAFPTEDRLARMVRVRLSRNLNAVAGGGNLTDIVFNLIVWAESELKGGIKALVQSAREDNPDNQQLKDYEERSLA